MSEYRPDRSSDLDPRRLRDHLDRHGGFTIGLSDGHLVTIGHSVAVAPSMTLCFELSEWNERVVAGWLYRVSCASGATAIGGWVDAKGFVHLDIVEVVGDLVTAARLGRAARQRCVFDLQHRTLVGL